MSAKQQLYACICSVVALVALLVSCGKDPASKLDLSVVSIPATDDADLRRFLARLDSQAKADPSSATNRGRLAMAYDANGFSEAAVATYAQAASLDPREMRWPYLQALANSQQGNIESAVQLMEQAIRLDPTYLPSYLAKGYWLLDLGRHQEACENFRTSETVKSTSQFKLPLVLGLIQCHFELGDDEQARQLLAELPNSDLPPYALQVRDRVLRTRQNERVEIPMLNQTNSKPLSWSDPVAGAVVEFTRGLSGESLLAQKLIDGSRAADGLPLIRSLRSQYPAEAHLLELHSAALVELDRHAEAIEVLETGIGEFKGEHLLHFNLGLLYVTAQRTDEALRQFDRTLAIEPSFVQAYDAKATLLINQNANQAARETLEASLKLRSPDAETHYLLGVLFGGEGEWLQSIDHFTQAIELRPDSASAHASLALSLSEMGRIEDAFAAIQSARKLAPNDPTVQRAVETLVANDVLEAF
ncbi:MAG: tetratricopeptide repeat protein [Gammaproteobacteria bacterium]|nr:tetratricopeptide repeat protein [Gammaproteobacteria bacterium]